MRHFIPLIIPAIITACANLHPVKTVGPNTFKLTHTMPTKLPAQGGLNALTGMAQKHCTEEDGPYTKLSEDTAVTGKTQTVTLTFTCSPTLKPSAYNPSTLAPTAATSYTAPQNLKPEEILIHREVSVSTTQVTQ